MDSPEPSESDKESLSPSSIHTLKILDEVASGRPLTQRDISQKLGIALGMTNNYLKRLARLGYIESNQAGRRRLQYFLTPKGIAEKSLLTYRYIKNSYNFFTDTRVKMSRFFGQLENEGVRAIVLYKATVVTEIAVLVLLDTNLELIAIVDDDIAGQKFLGKKIEPVKALSDLTFDRLVITTGESEESVTRQLRMHGVAAPKLCSLTVNG